MRDGGACRDGRPRPLLPVPVKEIPDVPDLPLNPDLRPPYRRRLLLRLGQESGWWTYESENPPGHVADGWTYARTSYTLRLPDNRRVALLVSEVDELLTLTTWEAVRAAVERMIRVRQRRRATRRQ